MAGKLVEYAFVLDADGKPLSPTRAEKAWYKIRKKTAKLVSKYPLTIQLLRSVPEDEIDKGEFRLGIDDGAKHVGLAVVQACKTRNKAILKATLEHRQDVSKKLSVRAGYRRYRRSWKRYHPRRFDNRASSKRKGRVSPSILQKRQAVVRAVRQLCKYVRIDQIHLEDVAIDVRALADGFKSYSWQYRKSNRLDENIRKAVIIRDKNACQLCGKTDRRMEVHHIVPRRKHGPNTLANLITLCEGCHKAVTGQEGEYETRFFGITGSKRLPDLASAQHVMAGKDWLRRELARIAPVSLTTGGDTANRRIDWDIEKSHANDAVCVTGLRPDDTRIMEYELKPIRRKLKAKTDNVLGIRHHDLVQYTYRNGVTYRGYVTGLYPDKLQLNFKAKNKDCKRVNAAKCKLLWTYVGIYWFKSIDDYVCTQN